MPKKRRTQQLEPGEQATMRSPFYHKYKISDIEGKRVTSIVTLNQTSNVSSYPEHIQGIWRNRLKRKGGMPFKIVKFSTGEWLPLSQVKLKRDNEYGTFDNNKKENFQVKTTKKISSKNKLTETIKKLIKMEIKKQLNEEIDFSEFEDGEDTEMGDLSSSDQKDFYNKLNSLYPKGAKALDLFIYVLESPLGHLIENLEEATVKELHDLYSMLNSADE